MTKAKSRACLRIAVLIARAAERAPRRRRAAAVGRRPWAAPLRLGSGFL